MTDTFLWHDYETFGADPRRDRPAQFAALRTNTDLEPIEAPLVVYCQPGEDMLPQPAACMITGITPQLARQRGVVEHEFAGMVFEAMSRPGTCSVGYNNFRFDDEVSRHLFWRNFIDPYAREFANGNSRFDLIDLTRLTRALRPAGLQWPDREDGTPSFRLEDLAQANGMDTSRAHDALADVEATLGLARLIRSAQPRLWQWALGLRERHQVDRLLRSGQPLLHASARLPAQWCATAPILPLGQHPQIRSQWVVWNLRENPAPFLDLDPDELADLLWTPAADLPPGHQRLPVKLIRSNRCPMLSPMNVLDAGAADRLAMDPGDIRRHAQRIDEAADFRDRLLRLFGQDRARSTSDPEIDLYSGFTPRTDHAVRDRVRTLTGADLAALGKPFSDERLNTLLFRYRARGWPESLDETEKARWAEYRRRRLIDDPDLASIRLHDYQAEVSRLLSEHPEKRSLLEDLMRWPDEIGCPMAATNIQ